MLLYRKSSLNKYHGSSHMKMVKIMKEKDKARLQDDPCRVKINEIFRKGTDNNKAS